MIYPFPSVLMFIIWLSETRINILFEYSSNFLDCWIVSCVSVQVMEWQKSIGPAFTGQGVLDVDAIVTTIILLIWVLSVPGFCVIISTIQPCWIAMISDIESFEIQWLSNCSSVNLAGFCRPRLFCYKCIFMFIT